MRYADLPPFVIVDASNVAFGRADAPPARLANLRAVLTKLRATKVEFVTYLDASLRWKVDDPKALEALFTSIDGQSYLQLTQTPKGEEADKTILTMARYRLQGGKPVYILTDDKFRDHPEAEGIPRIEFRFRAGGDVNLAPPLDRLLSRHAYVKAYPKVILKDEEPCPHMETVGVLVNGHISDRCELCGETVVPEPEYEDEPEEDPEVDQDDDFYDPEP